MTSGNYNSGDDTKIKGDDGTVEGQLIAAIDDSGVARLAVDAKFKAGGGTPVTPAENVVYFTQYLVNGSNKSMDVDGSSTAQVFEIGPPGGETWYVTRFTVWYSDSEIKDQDRLGNVSNVNNGLLIEWDINSVDYEIANIHNNAEVATAFLHGYSHENDFIATEDPAASMFLEFKVPVTLTGDNGDTIKSTVRDDLRGLDDMFMLIEAFKVI